MDFVIDITNIIRGTLDLPSRPIFSLGSNIHFVGVRLISTGGKPLCQTRFSLLAAPLACMDFFYSAFYCISCAVRTFHAHISHQHSIIGRCYKESFLSVLGCWVYCTYISAQVDCRAVSIYLLQEATSSNTYSASQRVY